MALQEAGPWNYLQNYILRLIGSQPIKQFCRIILSVRPQRVRENDGLEGIKVKYEDYFSHTIPVVAMVVRIHVFT